MRALLTAAALYAATISSMAAQAPSARTVWDGAFTSGQAERGQSQYAAYCAGCHGPSLEGGMGASLVGTAFWNKWREQSVADLLAYVSKNMPMGGQAGGLSPTVYADIVAHVLKSNDLPAGGAELTPATGIDVRIVPRGGGSGELPASTLARIVGCLSPQGVDRSWRVVRAGKAERVTSTEAAAAAGAPGGDREYALKFVLQPLTPLVGQKVSVVGLLLGEGGADGINVSTVTSLASTCD